jgi:hypothetical protein
MPRCLRVVTDSSIGPSDGWPRPDSCSLPGGIDADHPQKRQDENDSPGGHSHTDNRFHYNQAKSISTDDLVLDIKSPNSQS